MAVGLTPRQRELMAYIEARDVFPCFEEMGAALGIRISRIYDLLSKLEERGHIKRIGHGPHVIRFVNPPRFRVILTPDDCERIARRNRASTAEREAA